MQIFQRLINTISEEGNNSFDSSLLNERVLHNETSTERYESVDPITGAQSVSIVERSVTQREVQTKSGLFIFFRLSFMRAMMLL
jgi:hypothetical protein